MWTGFVEITGVDLVRLAERCVSRSDDTEVDWSLIALANPTEAMRSETC
jgi:hypothetical protein